MKVLEGKVAIVTGAGRGIGRAIALAFAAEGAAVALAARSRAELAEVAGEIRTAGGGRALAIPTDVTNDGAVEALVEQTLADLGRLDILITSAGTAAFAALADSKPADRDAMLSVNLRAAIVCCPLRRVSRWLVTLVPSLAAVTRVPRPVTRVPEAKVTRVPHAVTRVPSRSVHTAFPEVVADVTRPGVMAAYIACTPRGV